MSLLDYICIFLGIIIVLPIVVFLCVKLGTVGFYKGKEAFRRQSESDFEFDNVEGQDNDNKVGN